MSVLFLLSYAAAILPVVLLFGAAGLESLFDVSMTFGVSVDQSRWILIWGIGGLGSLYAIFGGLRAVAVSDTINGIGFLFAGILVTVLALMAVGDGNAVDGLSTVYTEQRPKFDITGNEPGSFLPFGVLFTGLIVNQVFFWCVNQSILQRALGARSLAEGQKGVLIGAPDRRATRGDRVAHVRGPARARGGSLGLPDAGEGGLASRAGRGLRGCDGRRRAQHVQQRTE
jgi:SSS family solute:Na+ symporter